MAGRIRWGVGNRRQALETILRRLYRQGPADGYRCPVSHQSWADACFVYVIGPDGGPYKVGVSRDPESRLRSLATGHPLKLSILDRVEVAEVIARQVERRVHRTFAAERLEGEWLAAGLDAIREALHAEAVSADRCLHAFANEAEAMWRQMSPT